MSSPSCAVESADVEWGMAVTMRDVTGTGAIVVAVFFGVHMDMLMRVTVMMMLMCMNGDFGCCPQCPHANANEHKPNEEFRPG